ncbi:MAG: hypothetical protein SOW84_03720 [Candidatus Faecousia sp.]|nr:hypothetical protein [Candidatus Faecousia sp.]
MKQKYHRYLYLLPSVLWILAITLLTYFCASNRLDSDMSAELVLAKQLAAEHKLLTTQWFYSTELRLANTQLLAVPLFAMGFSFRMVRTLQCFVLQVLLLCAYLFCMKQLKVGERARYVSAMFLFVPFSMTFIDIVQIGNFYIPHYIFLFVMLGLTASCLRRPGVWRVTGYLALSFLCGLSSVRYLLMIQFPLLAASLLLLQRESAQAGTPILTGNTIRQPAFWLPASGLVVAGVGYVMNEKLLHRLFSFRSNADVPLTDFSRSGLLDRISGKLTDIFKLFGYWDGHSVMSLSGICSLFAVGCVVLIACMAYQLLKDGNALSRFQYLTVQMLGMSVLIATFVYVFSNGFYQSRYYIPSIILFVPVLGIFLDRNPVQKRDLRVLTAGTLCVMLLFNGLCSVFWTWRYDENRSIKEVCDFLQEEDLTFGYASFWNGSVLTELSEGAVTMVNIKNFSTMQTDNWLMATKYAREDIWENPDCDRNFLLLTDAEYQTFADSDCLKQTQCVYDAGGYKVFVRESHSG